MKSLSSLLTVSLMLATGTVLAADPPKVQAGATPPAMDHGKMEMSGMTSADHQKMATEEFAKLDKNKDGKLSKVEIPAEHPLAAHFGMLDGNKDGSVSKGEFDEHHSMMGMHHGSMDHSKMDHSRMEMSGMTSADHQKMAAEEFARLDKNKDGNLSKAEFAGHHAMMGMQHGKMDHSKMDMSGTKRADHQKMATEEFTKLDSNNDGKLSKAEIPAQHPLAAHLGMLDTDKDGSLSKAEFAKHHGM